MSTDLIARLLTFAALVLGIAAFVLPGNQGELVAAAIVALALALLI